jgi:hypothetical protein
MRKLKGSGNHLRNQTWKNLAKAVLCIVLFGAVSLAAVARLIFSFRIGLFEEVLLAVSLAPLAAFYYFLHRYRVYKGGWEGERRVNKLLNETLSDDYFLINGVRFRGGDIDHIVLGPNRVFVLETKNWSGKITCNGDQWQRQSGRRIASSPSEQAKRNAANVRRIIEASGTLPFTVWVEAIVVFTNTRTDLQTHNPTIPILKLNQLPNHLSAHRSPTNYSPNQIEAMGKEIVKQTH